MSLTVTPATGMPSTLPVAGTTPRLVIGLDLSLTSTGIAGDGWTANVRTKTRGDVRLRILQIAVADYIKLADLVVMEGPSYGHAALAGHEDLAGLRVLVRQYCYRHHIPYAVIPPSSLKVYATGNGRASKGEIRDAIATQYGHHTEGTARYDEADAYTAMAAGYDWLGQPLAALPESHRRALKGCAWPALLSGGAL
ncbi:hypothetical protein OOK31_25375 [Streptomyces sp. NBC_00249]|uniref:hypothetical protein n=1 Tax=Streptomyces sp. NBC_00249 TaxID=2975690 RepID=UPI00224E37D3|nr:hypothetical protein [Streptomyces sp. NBC_00249]MCX5197188.1 hypothetical protein [Streptomyces sp. NBC_00249]